MTHMTERTIENPVVLCNAQDERKPKMPKFTVFANVAGITRLCLVRVSARNAEDALWIVEEDEAGYDVLGIISGHHTDAWANHLGMAASERTEKRAYERAPLVALG